jgi:hypothetical protein
MFNKAKQNGQLIIIIKLQLLSKYLSTGSEYNLSLWQVPGKTPPLLTLFVNRTTRGNYLKTKLYMSSMTLSHIKKKTCGAHSFRTSTRTTHKNHTGVLYCSIQQSFQISRNMHLVECTGILLPTAMMSYSPTFRYLLRDKGIHVQHNIVLWHHSPWCFITYLNSQKYTILTKSPPGQVYSQINTSRPVTYTISADQVRPLSEQQCVLSTNTKKMYLQHFTFINKLSFPNYYHQKTPTETIFWTKRNIKRPNSNLSVWLHTLPYPDYCFLTPRRQRIPS